MKKPFEPAPPDPPFKPNGIRARALEAVLRRRPRPPETPEELQRAQEFWAKYREGQKLLARAEQEGARLGRPPTVEIIIKKTQLPTPHLAIVTTKVTDDPHRLEPFATFVLDDSTGEITDLSHFASVAVALLRHDEIAREQISEAAE